MSATDDIRGRQSGSSAATRAQSRKSAQTKVFLSRNLIWGLGLGLAIFFALMSDHFFTPYNLSNILLQCSLVGFLAVGLTPVVINGNIDLTVGAVVGLAACLTIGLQPLGTWNAIGIALASGVIIGFVNGIIVEKTGVNSFIVTLAGMIGVRGVVFVIFGDTSLSPVDENFWLLAEIKLGPFSGIAVLFVISVIIFQWMLMSTRHGRNTYAVGGNRAAARDAGVPVSRTIIYNFMLCGLMAAISGVATAAYLSAATPSYGKDYELWAVIAVVLGGTSLRGGRGTVLGTFAAALTLAILRNGLNLVNVSPFYVAAIMGAVLIAALLVDRQFNRSGDGRRE